MEFDSTKSFDDNLVTFLKYMNTNDKEMSKILSDNVAILKTANNEASRRRSRIEFNAKVISALDGLDKVSGDV